MGPTWRRLRAKASSVWPAALAQDEAEAQAGNGEEDIGSAVLGIKGKSELSRSGWLAGRAERERKQPGKSFIFFLFHFLCKFI